MAAVQGTTTSGEAGEARGNDQENVDGTHDDNTTQSKIESQLNKLPKFTIYISDFIDVLDHRWELEGAGQKKPDEEWYINKGHPFDKYTRISFCKGFWCTLKEAVTAEEHLMFLLRGVEYKDKKLFELTEIEGEADWNQGSYHLRQIYWPVLEKMKEIYGWLRQNRENGPQVPGWWREDMLDRWMSATCHTMRKRVADMKSESFARRNIPAGVPKLSSRQTKEKSKQVYPLYAMRFVVQDGTDKGRKDIRVQFPRVFVENDGPERIDVMLEQDSFTKLQDIVIKEMSYDNAGEELGYAVVMALGREEFCTISDSTSLQTFAYTNRKAAEQEMKIKIRTRAASD